MAGTSRPFSFVTVACASGKHLDPALEIHQSGLDLELRQPFGHLLAELAHGLAMGFGFDLPVGDLGFAISDLRRAAVAVVDGDHALDVVQLHRGPDVVPVSFVPVLERLGDHADRRPGDDERTEFAGEMPPRGVAVHRLLQARVDAADDHGFVVAARRMGEFWHHRREARRAGADQEMPAVEPARQEVAAAGAGSLELHGCVPQRHG